MLKRIFWLALALLAGWIVWRWLQQRQGDFGGGTSQFGPLEPPVWGVPTPPVVIGDRARVSAPADTAPADSVGGADLAGPVEQAAPEAAGSLMAGAAVDEQAAPEAAAPMADDALPPADDSASAAGLPDTTFMTTPEAVVTTGDSATTSETTSEFTPSAPEAALPSTSTGAATERAADVPVESAPAESSDHPHALDEVIGYCVRCKTKRTIAGAHQEITESGRRAARGTCPVCGAKMFTFLPTD